MLDLGAVASDRIGLLRYLSVPENYRGRGRNASAFIVCLALCLNDLDWISHTLIQTLPIFKPPRHVVLRSTGPKVAIKGCNMKHDWNLGKLDVFDPEAFCLFHFSRVLHFIFIMVVFRIYLDNRFIYFVVRLDCPLSGPLLSDHTADNYWLSPFQDKPSKSLYSPSVVGIRM